MANLKIEPSVSPLTHPPPISQDYTPTLTIPHHVPPQQTKGRRKRRSPAVMSKLNRPIIRFYCNDCKKKFRSRLLANRNNNAVQHYCQLYGKIITRKVDSHSNKCKGDHGLGACVVKRTDIDPDSDGEDETKAAYYVDRGKQPKARRFNKPRTTTSTKRKRDDNFQSPAKRARMDGYIDNGLPPPMEPTTNYGTFGQEAHDTYLPPPPPGGGYYHSGGYAQPQYANGHSNGYSYGYYNGMSPEVPMAVPNHMDSNSIPPQVDDGFSEPTSNTNSGNTNSAMPPPPPLEEFGSAPPLPPMEPSPAMEPVEGPPLPEPNMDGLDNLNPNHTAFIVQNGHAVTVPAEELENKVDTVTSQTTIEITSNGEPKEDGNGTKKSEQAVDDEECINDANTDDEDIDLSPPDTPLGMTTPGNTMEEEDEINLSVPE